VSFKAPTPTVLTSAERDQAFQASLDCPYCGGQGMISVYHPAFTGSSVGMTKDGRQYPAAVAAHCRCELGVWIRGRNPPEIQSRIPWVQDILLGSSRWLLIAPGEREIYPCRPVNSNDFQRIFPFLERLRGRFQCPT
jgi:hypothetical protein